MQKGFCVRRYPRKAPKAIASGISFRDGDLGSAKAVELIKVCDFYESKASGEYVDSALSGRYVHAMAKEVRTLACALKAGEDEQKARIRELEVCCREWDEHFGPSSDARGRLTRAVKEYGSARAERLLAPVLRPAQAAAAFHAPA